MPDAGSAAERIEYRRQNAVDPEAFLLEHGIVEATEHDENLRFSSGFATRVNDRLDKLRVEGVETADIATMFGVEDAAVTEADRSYTAFKTNNTVRNWPSDAALLLDVATDRELRQQTDRWDAVPVRQRFRMLQSLRSFQESCLFCSGQISISDETVDSCCGDMSVVTVACTECDRRFLEFSPDAVSSL